MSVAAIESLDAPWLDERPSIYRLTTDALAKRGTAKEALDIDLPPKGAGEIRWAAGALDRLIGKPDDSRKQINARKLVAAINSVLRQPTKNGAAHLYGQLCENDAISVVDAMLPRVMGEIGERSVALAAFARRLILESPEIEPVKAGVALLGVSGTTKDAVLISTIGHFEEITLYSVMALCNLLDDAETAIWELAKNVYGWGRIQAVGRLAATKNTKIKEWMLRDGFRNSVMYEYLAYTCATACEKHLGPMKLTQNCWLGQVRSSARS